MTVINVFGLPSNRRGPRHRPVGPSALVAFILATTCLVLTVVVAGIARADDVTVSYDAQRTGYDPNEPALSPGAVSSSNFGSLFSTTLPRPTGASANQVYAQPIVAGGTLVVATEENQLHGLDPATGAVRWTTTLGPAWPAATSGCGDLTPDIGITSTPVYDASTNTVYAVGKVNDGADVHHPRFKMAAVDATTGAMRTGWPVVISGAPGNDPFRAFDAEQAGQRAGLLLLDGRVYAGFASHCSYLPYVGYVAGVSTTTQAVNLWTTEAGGASSGGGVWQSGSGLASDGSGQILLATGNGFNSASPPTGPGTSPPPALAESVVRLGVSSSGVMTATDFFSPVNNPTLDKNDTDVGSGGPVVLPDSFGTAAFPHLLMNVGKDGRIFLLNRDDLGGTGQGSSGGDKVLSQLQIKGVWGHFAVWPGDGGYAYIVENSGNLRALRITANGQGVPTLSVVAASAETFGYTSGSPVVTANGTAAGSALVWVVQSSGPTGAGGKLLAYDAVPSGGVMRLRYSTSIGTVAKFAVPATDAGRVFVGNRDGQVLGFGSPTTAALTGSPLNFGPVAVKTGSTRTAVLKATTAVTITAVSTTPKDYSVGSLALPVSLAAGDTLSVPVTFTPSEPEAISGELQVTTASSGTVLLDLNGTGTAPGLAAEPDSVAFGTVALKSAKQTGVTVRNTGTDPVTVSAVHGPDAPFTLSGLPKIGSTVAPGASFTFTVTAAPTEAGDVLDYVRIFWAGTHLRIPLSVTGVDGSAKLTLAPARLDFGQIPPGGKATLSFDIANSGTAPVTLTKAAPPSAPFRVDDPVAEGTVLAPGQVIHQSVSVYPTSALDKSGTYAITGNDGQGEQGVSVEVNATPPTGQITIGGKCVTASDAAHPTASNAVVSTCTSTAAQLARIPGDGTLSVAGACFNASGKSAGDAVTLRTCANAGPQKWSWSADQSVVNRGSSLCMGLPTGTDPAAIPDGTALDLHSCSASPDRQFDLAAITASRGFVTGLGGLCLDARAGRNTPGTPIDVYTCNSTAAQKVTLAPGSGTFQVLGACLQAAGTTAVRGALMELDRCSGQPAQQWIPQPGGTVVNPATGLCLDVPGARAQPGAQLDAYSCNQSAAQQWTVPQ